jgi:hypothetical protein
MVRVKHGFSAAMGCSARLLRHFRAGADAKVAARRQPGDRPHEPARRRTGTAASLDFCDWFGGLLPTASGRLRLSTITSLAFILDGR